jgi:hypothetical protein
MKRNAVVFSRYDESAWKAIMDVVRRILSGPIPINLRLQLEELGRDCLRDARSMKDREYSKCAIRTLVTRYLKSAEPLGQALKDSQVRGNTNPQVDALICLFENFYWQPSLFLNLPSQSRYNAQKNIWTFISTD